MKYPGENKFILSSGYLLVLLLLVNSISLFIFGNLTGIIVGILLLLLNLFIVNKIILSLQFDEDSIIVRRVFRSPEYISYANIYKIYLNYEGFLFTHVYVVRYKLNEENKKVTFYCKRNEISELEEFLKEKSISIGIKK